MMVRVSARTTVGRGAVLLCGLLGLLGMRTSAARAQQPATANYTIHRDVIRGRVTTDSGAAVAGGDVAITMAPDRQSQFAKTDSAGQYQIVFATGTGDYLVHVAAPGRLAFRRRITRTASDSVFTVDAVLKPAVQQLAAVKVEARRQKAPRNQSGGFGPGIGAAEQVPNGVNSLIPPDQAGNLDAIAATLPGVSAVAGGGVSVLGLAPSQNNTTLNGLAFGGGGIPRGASTTTRVSTSVYDPARGGFSGAQTQIQLAPGDITVSRRGYITLDAPQLQAADAVARRSGLTYTAVDLNLGTEGGTNLDRWMYNGGAEYKRQFSDATSLVDASADVLEGSGVARDSVARLLSTLGALGVPASGPGAPTSRVTDYVAFLGRLDRPYFDYSTYAPLNTTWGVTGYANFTRRGALNFAPTATPGHGGESQQLNAGGQYLYSAYFGTLKDQLNEFRTGLSLSHSDNTPYLELPDGRVLLASSFVDGTGGIASLAFAGNSALASSNRSFTWESTNETQFYWRGRAAHRGKLYVDSRLDGFSQSPAANRLGTFAFNSLADLDANRPASFSRTLSTPDRTGGEWTGVVALSDQWAATPRLSLLYGARIDGNRFTSTPAFNPQIESAFGARTDHAPESWHVSPRIGFNWLATKTARTAGSGMSMSGMGSFYTLARGVLRGGIGEFRQMLDPTLLADASAATGLASSTRRITCVGPAVPTPDWHAYAVDDASIPTDCVGGPGASGFADAAPAVLLYDRRYQPARAWRANLSWGSTFKGFSYTADAAYSLNVSQPSSVDLNFNGVQAFALPDEANRPVFVPATSIVSTTGAIAGGAARRDPTFGSVFERTSDLRGWARQISLRARPGVGFVGGKFLLDATYTFTQAQSRSRGFDGSTFGAPTAVTWARGDYTPTHELTLQAGYQAKWIVGTLSGKVSSGLPFTPLVGSDVNGDGLANDRAFIFNHGSTSDPALGAALDKLIASTSGQARDCLVRQRGSVAGRNSCQGPWFSTISATLAPSYGLLQRLKFSNRANMSLTLSNPLGGLDQLLHGSNLRGWGTPAFPDRVLYYVRGFDPATRRFAYEVNPRFGDTRPSATSFRVPFRMTLDVRLDFSRSGEEQQLDRILTPGRRGNAGTPLDSAAIIKRYCGNLPKWYDEILAQTDSLLLTRDQVDALREASATYTQRIMAHWGTWSKELAAIPDHYDVSDLVQRQNTLINDGWEIARQEAHSTLPKILTPVQLQLLPGNSATLYRAKEPLTGIRFFSSGAC